MLLFISACVCLCVRVSVCLCHCVCVCGVAFFLFEDLLFECVLLFEELVLLMGYLFDGDTHFCGGHAFSWGAFLGFANLRSFVSRPTTSVVKLVILSHGFW